MTKYPQTESGLKPKGNRCQCVHCGKLASPPWFTITAKVRNDDGRPHLPADLVQLSLCHVPILDLRQGVELPLSEGRLLGVANVVCCSADCLKRYFEAAVDELVRRGAKT
jgi:hypothetical protein